MASYEQVLKFENEKPTNVIRLVESHGFYRAYEQSAYLFHQAIAQHKVTKKFVKNIQREIVYVGFPIDKLEDRIGTRRHNKTEYGYDVELAPEEISDKSFRTYVASHTLRRIRDHLHRISPRMNFARAQAQVNSSLGVLSHYASYGIRRVLIAKTKLPLYGTFTEDGLRYKPNPLVWAFSRRNKQIKI